MTNHGFETGDFTGWDCIGDTSIQTASFGTPPRYGMYQAVLTTFDSWYEGEKPWEPALPLSGNEPVGYHQIETFLGLPEGYFKYLATYRSGEPDLPPSVSGGSAIKQLFHATSGSMLTFHYNFFTDGGWGNANDFAFFTLVSDGIASGVVIAGVESPDRPSGTVLDKETGYRRFTFSIPVTGDYSLGIGVLEMTDNFTGSAIAVDGFRLISRPLFCCRLKRNKLYTYPRIKIKEDAKLIKTDLVNERPSKGKR